MAATAQQPAEAAASALAEPAAAEPEPAEAAPKTYSLITGVRPQFGEGREEMGGGAYYEGPFRYSKRDGRGLLVSNAEGTERYEGEFANDFPDGAGIKTWANGSVYDGQFREGRKEGQGTLREPNGRTYTGQWKDGKRHGIGTQVLDEHTRYEGRWENGLQNGTGKYFDSRQETVYEGQWRNGHHQGDGLLRHKNGMREKLSYEHGMLKSKEALPLPTQYQPIKSKGGQSQLVAA